MPAETTPDHAARPGGWVDGIGWIARLSDLSPTDIARNPDGRSAQVRIHRSAGVTPDWGYVTVSHWADGSPAIQEVPHGAGLCKGAPTNAEIAAHMRAGRLVVGPGYSGPGDPILLSIAEIDRFDPEERQPSFLLVNAPDPRLGGA